METVVGHDPHKAGAAQPIACMEMAFGYARNFLDNHHVYVVLSSRARGLSVGLNLTPDRTCNFDCVYCEVNRDLPVRATGLDVDLMAAELRRTLSIIHSGQIRKMACFSHLPPELLQLRHVALSGDGEPTLCPQFKEVVQSVIHLRALGEFPLFNLVLVTNGSGLGLAPVQHGLKFFTRQDEIWVKLDAGTQQYMDRVNRPHVPLDRILANILALGRQRPVIIQSLFLSVEGEDPTEQEIDAYARRLVDLTQNGARISLVQIYSMGRPSANIGCAPLPLKMLSRIAQQVRRITALPVEVF